jgi:hypothetical protein
MPLSSVQDASFSVTVTGVLTTGLATTGAAVVRNANTTRVRAMKTDARRPRELLKPYRPALVICRILIPIENRRRARMFSKICGG